MQLNFYGELVLKEWQNTASKRPYLDLDSFVVMPNHVHGIVIITGNNVEGRTQHAASLHKSLSNMIAKPVVSGSLSAVIRSFKSAVTKQINEQRHMSSEVVWQERYHDHIIRNEAQLNYIREYILYNPASWQSDKLFTAT
jgi:REP element-mobilizing transposase RayT